MSNKKFLSAIPIALLGVLLAVYWLSFSAIPATDDELLFVSGAQSLALWGELSAPQMYGNLRLLGSLNDVEIFHTVLAAWVFRWVATQPLSNLAPLFLLNGYYTALTGVCIYLIGVRRGYSPPVAVWCALLFSFCTLAWPYAHTFFRDTLAMLFLTAALLAVEVARQHGRRWWLAVFILLLGGMLTKNTVTLVLPLFILVYLPLSNRGWLMLTAGAGALVVLAGLGTFQRFSFQYWLQAFQILLARPHDAFWSGIWGALVSPGKGLLIYSPIVLLVPLGWRWVGRHNWREGVFPVLGLAALLAAQSYFYDAQWWTITWGTRYLLPVMPALMLATLPALVAASKSRVGLWGVAALSALGGLPQLAGVLLPWQSYDSRLYQLDVVGLPPPAVREWWAAPLVQHSLSLLQGSPLAAIWYRLDPLSIWSTLILVTALIISGLAASVCLWLAMRRSSSLLWATILAWSMAALLLAPLPYALVRLATPDPLFYASRADYRAATDFVQAQLRPGDGLFVRGYLDPYWQYFLNFARPIVPWHSLHVRPIPESEMELVRATPQEGLDASTLELFVVVPKQYTRLWLVVDEAEPLAFLRLEETWLEQQLGTPQIWMFGSIRVILFACEGK